MNNHYAEDKPTPTDALVTTPSLTLSTAATTTYNHKKLGKMLQLIREV
jgi:hypothetical protein